MYKVKVRRNISHRVEHFLIFPKTCLPSGGSNKVVGYSQYKRVGATYSRLIIFRSGKFCLRSLDLTRGTYSFARRIGLCW